MVYVSKPVWHIPLLYVQWKTPDDGQRNCPKRVEFHSKNKFEKLMHLVGFIITNWTRCTVTWTSKLHSYECNFNTFVGILFCNLISARTRNMEHIYSYWHFRGSHKNGAFPDERRNCFLREAQLTSLSMLILNWFCYSFFFKELLSKDDYN